MAVVAADAVVARQSPQASSALPLAAHPVSLPLVVAALPESLA
jgi:hypothetical protein